MVLLIIDSAAQVEDEIEESVVWQYCMWAYRPTSDNYDAQIYNTNRKCRRGLSNIDFW